MKKTYFSLTTIVILLFTACGNDVPDNENASEGGTLETTISFEGMLKAASSTAIPTVSWTNVNKVQLFLYDKTSGKVTFSRTVKPTDAVQTFKWSNIPAGDYRLALLANVKSSEDAIATSIDGGSSWATEFTDNNVIGKNFNSSLKIDLKSFTLPANIVVPNAWGSGRKGYAAPSEIFTAYDDNVKINPGDNKKVDNLKLRHEISLLRVRVNPGGLSQRDKVHFDNASAFIAVQRVPVGFGMKVGSFEGGILDTPSDVNRVMFGVTGTGTYKTTNPTTGYKPANAVIVDNDFPLWNDIRVLPNVSEKERIDGSITKSGKAPANRKYYIIISAWVDAGYIFSNNPETGEAIVAKVGQPAYWGGVIDDVFTKNTIREVNMVLKTPGSPLVPHPGEEGSLDITVMTPEEWNSVIEHSDIEL